MKAYYGNLRVDACGSVFIKQGNAYVFCGKLQGRSLAQFIRDFNANAAQEKSL